MQSHHPDSPHRHLQHDLLPAYLPGAAWPRRAGPPVTVFEELLEVGARLALAFLNEGRGRAASPSSRPPTHPAPPTGELCPDCGHIGRQERIDPWNVACPGCGLITQQPEAPALTEGEAPMTRESRTASSPARTDP